LKEKLLGSDREG